MHHGKIRAALMAITTLGFVTPPSAQAARLVANRDSHLKADEIHQDELPSEDTCPIPAGTVLETTDAPQAFSFHHLHVRIARGTLPACPERTEGFVWGPDFGLRSPAEAQEYHAIRPTTFRKRPLPVAQLAPEEICALPQGAVLFSATPARPAGNNLAFLALNHHVRCPFTEGYFFAPDFGHEFESPMDEGTLGDLEFGRRLVEFAEHHWDAIRALVVLPKFNCAEFASSTLKLFGYELKHTVWAPTFSHFLERRGWLRIHDLTRLQPGDYVITRGADHVFLFVATTGNGDEVLALDNQGNTHIRNLNSPDSQFTPAWYGLRKPLP